MFITALCPTYRRPELLANSLWLWNQQDYPAAQCHLMICDTGGTFDAQAGPNWEVHTPPNFDCLPEKHNWMQDHAPPQTDAFVSWSDDDFYLPRYVSSHAEVLGCVEFSRPLWGLSHYAKTLQCEKLTWWDSVGFSKGLMKRLNGHLISHQSNWDDDIRKRMAKECDGIGEPWTGCNDCQYCFGFSGTGARHCSTFMKSTEDFDWNKRYEAAVPPTRHVGKLEAMQDARTKMVYELLKLAKLGPVGC